MTAFEHKLLRMLQMTEVEMLREIVRICEKNKLQYFLIGGTLLGAIRHKGFIPWDDDLDIAMPRRDYELFKKACIRDLSTQYYLHCIDLDPEYWVSFIKIRKKGTLFEPKQDMTINTPYKGVFVDIFPLDNARKQKSFLQDLQNGICKALTSFQYRRRNATMNTKTPIAIQIAYPILNLFSIKAVSNIIDWVMKLNKNESAPYFTNIGSNINIHKQTMPKDKFIPARKAEFEGELYYVPNDYDYVLNRLYGDYMCLPPENKRITHKPNRIEL